jgi:hypothetical protein
MSPPACPVCRVLTSYAEVLLVQFVLALQDLVRTCCPACAEPWGEHGLAHPHQRVGRVSSCPGIEGEGELQQSDHARERGWVWDPAPDNLIHPAHG